MFLAPSLRMISAVCTTSAVLISLIATVIIFMWPWLRSPPIYYFPMPATTVLTETIAVELSRKVLAAEGKDTAGMCPIPYDDEGHYFAINTNDSNSGYVQWMTSQGSYSIRIERKGQQVVCQVYRLK